MRMWIGVEPEEMCRSHLLGEHRELHGLLAIPSGWSDERWQAKLRGHLERGQIQPLALWHRHETIAREMGLRGYKHESPLAFNDCLPLEGHCAELGLLRALVDREQSRRDLAERCPACRVRMGAGG